MSMKALTKTAACAIALTSLALSPACKKEGEESSGGGGGKAGKAAESAMGYMPSTASMVFGVNVQSLANAKVLSKYRDKMMSQAPDDFKEFEKACGMDVMKDISSVVVGMTDDEKGVIVVTGNFTQAKAEDCMKKVAEKEGEQLTMSDDGKMRVYSGDSDGKQIFAHWPKDGTVVLSPSELGGKDILSGVLGGSKLSDGKIMSLIKSTKTSASFWFAGNPKQLAEASPMGDPEMDGIAATVNAGDNLDIKVLINFPNDAKATEMVATAKMGMEMAKSQAMAKPFLPIIEKFKIEADGKAIKAGISLTSNDIDTIANAAQQFGMGGF